MFSPSDPSAADLPLPLRNKIHYALFETAIYEFVDAKIPDGEVDEEDVKLGLSLVARQVLNRLLLGRAEQDFEMPPLLDQTFSHEIKESLILASLWGLHSYCERETKSILEEWNEVADISTHPTPTEAMAIRASLAPGVLPSQQHVADLRQYFEQEKALPRPVTVQAVIAALIGTLSERGLDVKPQRAIHDIKAMLNLGQRLGGGKTPLAAATAAIADVPVPPEPAAGTAGAVLIQFRLPSKKLVRRFMETDLVAVVLSFCKEQEGGSSDLDLRYGFPPKDLKEVAGKTIKKAKLSGGCIQGRIV